MVLGWQAAAMIDCPCRVPLVVHAKHRKIDVKDTCKCPCDVHRIGDLLSSPHLSLAR